MTIYLPEPLAVILFFLCLVGVYRLFCLVYRK